jgi:N6-adenosine-specific RNA methylase IME4/ParB-like chromosome segregation protein Spo0J
MSTPLMRAAAPIPFHPLADIFPLLEGSEFDQVCADIKANGLHEPIVLNGGKILDGRNRYRACFRIGLKPHYWEYEGDDPLGFVISLNLKRRHLDESQRALIAARLATLPRGSNQHAQICAPSQNDVAEMLNVSRRSVQYAAVVRDRGIPELQHAVEQGRLPVSIAARAARQTPEIQREAAEAGDSRKADMLIRQGAVMDRTQAVEFNARALGKYAVILADPPWQYNPSTSPPSWTVEGHYPSMELAEICALPVADIAHDDAILFLWATAPMVAKSLQVVAAWGFEYQTCLVWVKNKAGYFGWYARGRHELLMICKRGNPPHPLQRARPDSVIEAPRGEHSAKPEEAYLAIETMYPDLPKIELFARTTRPGWKAWGNQVESERKLTSQIGR